jgi:hypothetical protein
MNLGIVMRGEVLHDKRADGRAGRAVATWNTRRAPTRLTAGWTNRLFVASAGAWRGYFPLSGDVLWNPRDETAPYALIFDPRQWTPIAAVPAPPFRGWRYLESPPTGETASSQPPLDDHDQQHEASSPSTPWKKMRN